MPLVFICAALVSLENQWTLNGGRLLICQSDNLSPDDIPTDECQEAKRYRALPYLAFLYVITYKF